MTAQKGLMHYYRRLERILKGFGLRLTLLKVLEAFLRLAVVLLIVLIGSLLAQEGKKVFPYLPLIYYLLAWIPLILVLLVGITQAASLASMKSVAGLLEKKFPSLKDDVTNALLLCQQRGDTDQSGQVSEGLVAAHLQRTAAEVLEIPLREVANFEKARSLTGLLIILGFACTAALALDPHYLGRSFAGLVDPFSTLPVREMRISLEPVPAMVLRGTPVALKARAEGYIPERLSLRLWPEGSEMALLSMEPEGKGVFTYFIASAQTSFRYQATSGRISSAFSALKVVSGPEIGKIKLTLLPPEYTGLPRMVKEDGHIEAIKGTVVDLEARATKVVKEGTLILNERTEFPLRVERERLKGSMLVYYPGTYSLSVKDELGFENVNPVQYKIRLIPDKYPEGEIVSPAEDLEVAGNEVLPIAYTARDDFGITEVRLIYERAGTERSLPIQTMKAMRGVPSLGPAEFAWDLSALVLTPGDRVTYRLEVIDNDAVSGPKAGYSRMLTLSVRDEKDRAARDAEYSKEIADSLLNLLADHLEEAKDRKTLSQDIGRMMEKVDRHLERMGPEKRERYDLESLKRNMAALHRDFPELPQDKATQEMERLVLLAEDIAKQTRMREFEAIASEIRSRQRLLLDALREQKGPLDKDALQSMLKEIDKLKDLTRQVMEALSRMATQLPDEFMNNPDLKGLNFQDFFQDLEDIQKRLLAGDLKGALEAAQRLLQNLTEMLATLSKAGTQANRGAYDRIQSGVAQQASELEKILAEQKHILAGTETVDREVRRSIEKEMERRIAKTAQKLRESLEKLEDKLPSEEHETLADIKRLLEGREIERFSQSLDSLEQELAGSPALQSLVTEMRKITQALTPNKDETMTRALKGQLPGLASRQKTLHEKTRALGDMVEMLSQLFPGLDSEIITNLKDAAGSMDKASGRLGAYDAGGAIPLEEDAIQSLSRTQQSLQQASQQMAMRMQANQAGYPLAYDPRGGWYYGPWVPLPTLPQPKAKQIPERGFTGIDKEEFALPGKDAYKAPQILREKIMEALKEEVPARYRSEVDKYFRGLTE